jgi:copper chaperone CopZ
MVPESEACSTYGAAMSAATRYEDVMKAVRFEIEGMSCGHCVARVERTLARAPGVRVREVTVGAASVELDPGQTDATKVAAVLAEAGYPARAIEGSAPGE